MKELNLKTCQKVVGGNSSSSEHLNLGVSMPKNPK